jgi:hypothetical protein
VLDERWSENVVEIADALRTVLRAESTIERVRQAEVNLEGFDAKLSADLNTFGLTDLDSDPELHARIAFELGFALASTPHVDSLPAMALMGLADVSLGFDGPVTSALPRVAVLQKDAVYIEHLNGKPKRSSAGDLLVEHSQSQSGLKMGGRDLADRLSRFSAMTQAARITGAGQALLRRGVEYARERHQFGKPIGSYQGVSHRLANAATLLDAAELLVRKAAFAARPEAGGDGAPSPAFAIMVAAKAVEAGRFAATTVHQTFGGTGFALDCDVQLFSRRLRSWSLRLPRSGPRLAELGRTVLDSKLREGLRLLWHYDSGMPLPRWAKEADKLR